MPIYAASKDRSLEDVQCSLANLVRDFETDAPGNRKLIRALLESNRALFYSGAIEVLKGPVEARGAQYLIALLVSNGMLLEALCDPALEREQAIALGRAAVRVDPTADTVLARGLADSETGHGSVMVRDASRLMEILCEVGDPTHMMASMLRLFRHANPYLRSKAVKVVGRGSKSAKWARQRLNESDPRIRANAVEALWSVDGEEARTLLRFASADGNNRVAANALLGLYYLGESAAMTELIKMAGHASGVFRASAAWAMGETGDPRFSETLRGMLTDTDAIPRKRAFSALARIKNAAAQTHAGQTWNVAAKLLPGESQKGTRRLLIAVAGDDGADQPKVTPLGFLLNEGGSYVTSYRVTEKSVPETISVAFVMPRLRAEVRAFYEGVESCLKWRRRGDVWAILPYLETGDGEPAPAVADPTAPLFHGSRERLGRMLSEPPGRADCDDLWTAVWRAAKVDGTVTLGKRHVIILSSAEESRIAGYGLIANVQNLRLPVQAVASGPNQHLQDFCHAVHASFQVCAEEEIAEAVRQAYLTMLARYEIGYQPVVADAPSVKLRVQAHDGWGETTVAYRAAL